MTKLKRLVAGVLGSAIVVGGIVAINLPATLNAQRSNNGPAITNQLHQDVSAPLLKISAAKNKIEEDDALGEKLERLREESYPKLNKANFTKPDTQVQKSFTVKSSKTAATPKLPTSTGFNGLGDGTNGFTVNSVPPDTNMDVSASQIVEVVNSGLAVFSKAGARLYGPVAINTLWSGFGGGCQTDNDGDPTVAYDRLANRWIISQFAVSHTTNGLRNPYLQCVAVSKTSDATGQYYRYSFGYTVFPDYPKLAVWPDAYYTTFNGFDVDGSGWTGSFICAYDRVKMLAGQAATQACTASDPNYGGVLVATIDGSTPPTQGTQAYAMALDTSSTMAMWRLSPTFGARSSSLTKSNLNSVTIPNFNLACPAVPDYTCVPQLGTSMTLDTLADRLMNRFAYRRIGGQDSFVASHTVDGSTATSVRWYEFRPSGSSLTTYQSGTYNPNSNHRWMPSIAMDQVGNIAMVYSVSSSAMNPAMAVAGRLVNDTLGTLAQGESIVKSGTGSQITYSRWGDYSAMAVDPADDCTFWAATEYLAADGVFNWQTYISKFKFLNCAAPATAISSITNSGAIGSTITITGTSLAKVNQVKIGGIGATNVVASAGTVTATVAPGTSGGQVWVKTSDDQTATSGTNFTVTYPTVSARSVSPTTAKVGSSLTITGSNLNLVRSVTIGGVAATSFTATASTIYVGVPSGVTAGSAKTIILNTPNATPNVSAPNITISTGVTAPTISRVSSSRGGPGSAVTITGSNLASATAVTFGTTSARFIVLSSTSILATVPVVSSGGSAIKVTTAGGNSGLLTYSYQSNSATPTISSAGVAPTVATVGSVITVSGTNLSGVSAISFNGTVVSSFTVISATQITFVVPGSATSGNFTVTTPGGQVTYSGSITIY